MTRLLSILLILGFLSPSLSLASSTEIPDDEAFLTIYFFIDDDGRVFAVASLTDELFLWAYAPRSAGATRASDNGAMNLHSTSFANPHAATSIGNLTLTYNQNGNVLTRSDKISHTWDYNNRLIKVAPTPTLTYAYYTYDSSGTRITSTFKNESQAPATTTYPTAYFNTDGTTQKEHLFVNGVPAATVEKIGTGNPTIFWNSQDHLRSTSVVTNQTAGIAESVEYYAFGSIKSNTGAHKEQRKYTGHEFDILSKYTYAQSRYLDTKVGRFLSEDPAFLLIGDQGFETKYNRSLESFLEDPQELNSYSYVKNNPLRYTDPSGEVIPILLLVGISLAYNALSLAIDAYEINTKFAPSPLGTQIFTPEEKRNTLFKSGLDAALSVAGSVVLNPIQSITLDVVDAVITLTDRFFPNFFGNTNQQSSVNIKQNVTPPSSPTSPPTYALPSSSGATIGLNYSPLTSIQQQLNQISTILNQLQNIINNLPH